jgi:hypothetical protein
MSIRTLAFRVLACMPAALPAPVETELVPAPPPGAAIVSDGTRTARVGVAEIESGLRAWVSARFGISSEVVREEAARILATVGTSVPDEARVDVLRRADGSFAWINDAHGGAGRLLELIETPRNPLDDEGPPAPAPRRFTSVVVAGVEGPYRDLFAPRLVEQAGALLVVASSYSLALDAPGEPVTWIAAVPPIPDAPTPGETLVATRIAAGADARLARFGALWCCCMRELTPVQLLHEAAPLSVHWSVDLATWYRGAPADVETPVVDYDLTADVGALWIAGVVAGERPSARIWRLAAVTERWEPSSPDFPLPHAASRVRWLTAASGAPVPKLLLPTAGEGLAVIPIDPPRDR